LKAIHFILPSLTIILSDMLRPAKREDLPAINAIYNHYVLSSTCTYQTIPSTEEDRLKWFDAHGDQHPVIVAEKDGLIVGWGSLSRLHERQAFAYSVEDSVYLHHEWQGRGIGSLILQELLRLAEQIGYHTVLGAISGDQSASIALHEKFGFIQTSKLREVGYKFDRWLDVVWVQKML
jgi:phosphinothricin acetyltransferase